MAGFRNIKELVDAEDAGQLRTFTWRKSPTQASSLGYWFDLSMSPGNPVPQYYAAAPGNSVALAQSTDGGLFHGGNVSPMNKYLKCFLAMTTSSTPLPMPIMILDYLMYYPFIDESTTDPQTLNYGVVNPVTIPRYTTGKGVEIMLVNVAGGTGGQQVQFTYTNSDGTGGRVTPPITLNGISTIGTIASSNPAGLGAVGPFVPLQDTDTGVRSIESVQMLGADVGLFTIVLVQPLATMMIRGIDAPVERCYLTELSKLPQFKDDAYLNMICLPQGSLSGVALHGYLNTVWN